MAAVAGGPAGHGLSERGVAIGDTIPFTSIPWIDVLFVVLSGTMLLRGARSS